MNLRVGFAAAMLATGAPVSAQMIPAPTPLADALAAQMRILASSPRDAGALIAAGELSARLGDMPAAFAFFDRAAAVSASDPRLAAARAVALVQMERPGEALRLWETAERGGVAMAPYLADRGLAHDLVGQGSLAQADYRRALASGPDDEVTRRLALSVGMAGRGDEAAALLDPLLRRQDRAAWRARAFVLAMTGQGAEALRIASTSMVGGAALGPFLARLPALPPADRAFAVHFGSLGVTPARVADARLAPGGTAALAARLAAAGRAPLPAAVPVARAAAPNAVAARAPLPPVLGRAAPAPVSVRPVVPFTLASAGAPRVVVAGPVAPPSTGTPAGMAAAASVPVTGPPTLVAPITLASAGTPRIVVAVPPIAIAPGQTGAGAAAIASFANPALLPPASPGVATVAVRADAGGTPPSRAAVPPPPRRMAVRADGIAGIMTGISVPGAELAAVTPRPVPAPTPTRGRPGAETRASESNTRGRQPAERASSTRVRATGTDAGERGAGAATRTAQSGRERGRDAEAAGARTRAADTAVDTRIRTATTRARAADPAKAEPARWFVQVAGGANADDLGKDWRRVTSGAAGSFRGVRGWTTPNRATNRLLAGPFASQEAAMTFVNTLKKGGTSAFAWRSAPGQAVTALPRP